MIRIHDRSEEDRGNEGCVGCHQDIDVPNIAFAFQPIVDLEQKNVFSFEALVRGIEGEAASHVLSQITEANRYAFDQKCRQIAIRSAVEVSMTTFLSINFLPNAVYLPEACIRTTLDTAERYQFPTNRIIFETVESEQLCDNNKLADIFRSYKDFGFLTAIDDFGAGYSGLTLLTDFQPDIIKIDIALIRDVDSHKIKQRVVKSILEVCTDLGIRCIAEGVETRGERDFLRDQGVKLMQGYFFAKPAFKALAQVAAQAYE